MLVVMTELNGIFKKNNEVDIRGIEISKNKVVTCITKGLTVIEGNAFDLKQFPDNSLIMLFLVRLYKHLLILKLLLKNF